MSASSDRRRRSRPGNDTNETTSFGDCTFSSSRRHLTGVSRAADVSQQHGLCSRNGHPENALCDQARTQPQTNNRTHRNRYRVRTDWSTRAFFIVVGIMFLLGPRGVQADSYGMGSHEAKQLEFRGEMIFDRSEPPMVLGHMNRPQRRDEASMSSVSDPSPTSSIPEETSTLQTAAPTTTATLPEPFDTSLGNNFTAPSCPTFFHRFLSNSTFQSCLPLSLLLQTSSSFFQATKSAYQLTHTLDATCSVDVKTCTALMSSLATELRSQAACGADLQMQNPTVQQAYDGFKAYAPLYQAGCLTDTSSPSSGGYCFANAIRNASAPASSYVYYLALGVELPSGAAPACNQCLQQTMSILASAASDSTQPVNGVYGDAAKRVDAVCGSGFVQANVKTNAASPTRGTSLAACAITAVVVGLMALL